MLFWARTAQKPNPKPIFLLQLTFQKYMTLAEERGQCGEARSAAEHIFLVIGFFGV